MMEASQFTAYDYGPDAYGGAVPTQAWRGDPWAQVAQIRPDMFTGIQAMRVTKSLSINAKTPSALKPS